MDGVIQKIKDRLDIVEVISEYLKLQKAGQNFKTLCPFHSEKKPSFFVSPVRQIWHCFGCSKGGDIFQFIMEIEGVEFGDALKILAQKAGVELKPFKKELKTERSRLYDICELSCRFFEKQLHKSSIGKEAKKYLFQRGLKGETIIKWRLGYSPDNWRVLSDFLVGKGFTRKEIAKAGLAIESEKKGVFYDRFRGRITFPIFDLNSQVIGFGGRIFKKVSAEREEAKYINTPNTLLYNKSQVLYGLNFAKVEIRKKNFCILTEGYIDVIMSHQAGFENTIAVSGTALTHFQLKILKRYTSRLLTAFDMDIAGDWATKRGIDLAQKEDFEVKVIQMPKEKDPAEVILQDEKLWENLVNNAKEIMDFYFNNAFAKFDKETPEGKREVSRFFLSKLKVISNKILQSYWIQKLANVLKIPEEAIIEEFKKIITEKEGRHKDYFFQEEQTKEKIKQKTRKELLEEKVLSLIISLPKMIEILDLDKKTLCFFSLPMQKILITIKKSKVQDKRDLQKTLSSLEEREKQVKKILDIAWLKAEMEKDLEIKKELKICLSQLKEICLKDKLKEISQAIKIAEMKKDEKKVKDLMNEFKKIAQKLT